MQKLPTTSPTFANLSKTPPSSRSNADERNEGHCKSFSDFLGKVTTEEHRPSKKLANKNSHGVPFNPSKQHAMNTNLIIECNKPRIVYAQKKISTGRVRVFKRVTYDLLLVCRSSVEELVGPKNFKEFHICQNLNALMKWKSYTIVPDSLHVADIEVQNAIPSSHVEQMSTIFAVTV